MKASEAFAISFDSQSDFFKKVKEEAKKGSFKVVFTSYEKEWDIFEFINSWKNDLESIGYTIDFVDDDSIVIVSWLKGNSISLPAYAIEECDLY